jgi:transposase
MQSYIQEERVMTNCINWIGIDDHADKLTIAQYVGQQKAAAKQWEVDASEQGLRQVVRWLRGLPGRVRCVYEAGPCGYELYRLLRSKGIDCGVAAPSLTPRKPGDRIKTNRRDARKLAELHRADILTMIVVPERRQESVRDLLRARDDARKNVMSARHRLSKFLLRHGLRFRQASTWGVKHWQWIRAVVMPEPYEHVVLTEYIRALEERQSELRRLDEVVLEAAKEQDYAPLVAELRLLRGIDTLSAMIILSELGDLRRFASARQLMAAVGLVPSEYSTGDKTRRFSITKTGNAYVRHVLVQAAWHYRQAPRAGAAIRKRRDGQRAELVAIAKKADDRLHRRYRRLTGRGKRSTVAVTAIARELAGFVWAIGQHGRE